MMSIRSKGSHAKFSVLLVAIGGIVLSGMLDGCTSDSSDKQQVEFKVPAGWPEPVYQFTDNEVTNKRFELGRKLFYDPILSVDNTVSCGSCHQQEGAFAHIDHAVSHGINNLMGTRNAPPIFNLAWHSNFFWDGGVNHLEVQPVNPIQNPVEMGENISNVVYKLNQSASYKKLFNEAYGVDTASSQIMLKALAQFMAVIVSADSRYDKFIRGENGGTLSTTEMNGLQLFRLHCESCHKEPLFTDLSYRNNGMDSVFNDIGRELITLDPADKGKFKVPSLRNVTVSNPYMHDGRLKSLDKVLDHYINGVKNSPTLDPVLVGGIPLTTQQKADIIAFLGTLQDDSFLNKAMFSETGQ